MAKSACKCKETECEECPEWIFTLADLIMCMMGLFVILWVLKPGPKQDMTVIDGDCQYEITGKFDMARKPTQLVMEIDTTLMTRMPKCFW